MLRTFAVLAIVTASPRFAAAELPAEGVLAVTNHSISIQIVRIKPTGIEHVAERQWGGYTVQDLGFSDAKALWVLLDDSDGTKDVQVEKVVDGKLTDTILVSATQLPRASTPDLALMFGSAGEVWIESCQKRHADSRRCAKGVYFRVDRKPFEKATAKPAGIDDHRGAKLAVEGTAVFAPQKPPKGYTAKLNTQTISGQSVKGIVCTGPAGSTLSWPSASELHEAVSPPTKVTWVLAAPPIVRVDFEPNRTFETPPVYIIGCRERVKQVLSFGRELWGAYRHVVTDDARGRPHSKQTWSVYLGDKTIGAIDGTNLRVAPW